MTFHEAKEEVAKSRAYESWDKMVSLEHQINSSSWQFLLKATEEAGKIFARSKVNEQRALMAKHLNMRNVPKPTFE